MTNTKEYPIFYVLSTEQDKIFWTISEVSDRLNLEPYILRFWEKKFKKLQPTKKTSGTRHYKINDVRLIERIRDLLYKEGYTIEGAIKSLNKKTTKSHSKVAFTNVDEIEDNETSPTESVSTNDTAKTILHEIKKSNAIKEQLVDIIDDIDQIEILLK